MRPRTFVLLVAILTLGLLGPALAAAPSIVVDGSRLSADVPALVSGDRVLVPLRGVFEQLGARVWYDAGSQTASASLNNVQVRITLGSRTAWVNGQRQTLDIVAREVAGRVMIPLRFVAEALGVSVDYDSSSDTVVIVTGFKPGSFAAYAGGPVVSVAPKIAPRVEDSRPADGTIIGSQYPSIYARLAGGSSAVNPSTVHVTVDGEDVSNASTISSAYVSYTPSTALETGQHTVSITGSSDDGTPFSASWTFRVDAGSSSDYTVGSYGGGSAFASGSTWPWFGFGRFGFFPPGFSVFTPGQVFFVSGNTIEVIFISRFFPFGTAFFTIPGFPGVFPLTPWLGFPGFFFGFAQVPFGVALQHSVIAAHFTMPDGRKVIVHSTAPVQIDGRRTSLPPTLRFAVMPRLIGRPKSPHQLVVFRRVEPERHEIRSSVAVSGKANLRAEVIHAGHSAPVFLHPAITRSLPVVIHPARVAHPVFRSAPVTRWAPVIIRPEPVRMPVMREPVMWQWGGLTPVRAPAPVIPAKPR